MLSIAGAAAVLVLKLAPGAVLGRAPAPPLEEAPRWRPAPGSIENLCAAYVFGVGVIGGGGDSACFRDDVLTTHTKDSCSVECDVGYASNPTEIKCAIDAAHGAETHNHPTCVENACAAYVFGLGLVAGTMAPACSNDVVLHSRTDNLCYVMCGDGYKKATDSANVAILCARHAEEGEATTGEPTCTPASCLEPDHDMEGLTASDGCGGKATGDTGGCTVTCDDGYYVSHGLSGDKVCLADAGQDTASFRDLPTCTKCEDSTFTNAEVAASQAVGGPHHCQAWKTCGAGYGRIMQPEVTGDFVSDLACEACNADDENGHGEGVALGEVVEIGRASCRERV